MRSFHLQKSCLTGVWLSRWAAMAGCLLIILAIKPQLAFSDGPTTRPDDRQAQIRRWLMDLADADSAARDQAEQKLMGLSSAELPLLRAAVSASGPLLPGQVSALKDIVEQVYSADLPYDPAPAGGFLGLTFDPTDDGIVVIRRVPGFGAFRVLHEGDIIKKIINHPEIDLGDFPTAVGAMHAGDELQLQILRHGELLECSITLYQQPAFMMDRQTLNPTAFRAELNNWEQHRREQADDYWNKQFAPLVGDDLVQNKPQTEPDR